MDHSYLIEIIASLRRNHECVRHGDQCKQEKPECEEYFRYGDDANEQLDKLIELAREEFDSEANEAVQL